MSFQPVLPMGGFAGWAFLKRTGAVQQAALQAAPANQRDEAYFRANIGRVKTAEQLVGDRRLLRLSLAAFGLEGDVNSKAFIRKVLEDGTLKEGALATKLTDSRYRDFSAMFGFGDFRVPRTQLSDFADKLLAKARTANFEAAVGTQNNAFRLAMNAERELATLAGKSSGEDAKWFTVMGNAPLREVFQTAFGLPASFASIDLDQQLGVLKARAERFGDGTVSQFKDPARLADLVRTYLARSEVSGSAAMTPGSAALQLLAAGR